MNDKITELVMEATSIAKKIEQVFGALTVEQLNWKPNETSWSIAQCLDHLIITNKLEFPAIKSALQENYQNPLWSKLPFLSHVFGKVMIYLFSPKNPRKIKAPKIFRPANSQIRKHIVKDFVAQQQEVVELFQKSKDLDLQKIMLVSPITDFITYSLFDSYVVLLAHEERHFQQAKRVLEMRDSPK